MQVEANRGPIEELVPKLVLQAPDRLTDGGLGAVEALGGFREAPVRRDGHKCIQVLELHFGIISNSDIKAKTINWT